jgi:endo-1,4-beta-D-glucanase Y
MPTELLVTLVSLIALIVAATFLITSIRKDRVKQEITPQDPSRLPFPQHVHYALPNAHPDHVDQAEQDKLVQDAYQQWKAAFVLPDVEPGRSFLRMGVEKRWLRYRILVTAEGQGYAMLCSVLMAGADPTAQATFDRLYAYCKAHPSQRSMHLMSWQVTAETFPSQALGSSSHADMLIAYALLMADRQWGSKGRVDYLNAAKTIISALKEQCIHPTSHHVLQGNFVDETMEVEYAATSSGAVSPLIFEAFGRATSDPTWKKVSSRMLHLLKKSMQAENMVLAFPPDVILVDAQPEPDEDEAFGPESASVLLHLALASLLTGHNEAIAFLQHVNQVIMNASQGDPAKISAFYALDGEPKPEETDPALQSFCLMAASVSGSSQAWLNSLWDLVVSQPLNRQDPFGSTIRLLSMLLVSQNWWNLQARK